MRLDSLKGLKEEFWIPWGFEFLQTTGDKIFTSVYTITGW